MIKRVTDSLFLNKLPSEIREVIYSYILIEPTLWDKRHVWTCQFCDRDSCGESVVWQSTECKCAKRQGLSLLMTNRQIYHEAFPIFLSRNTLCFWREAWDAIAFLPNLNPFCRDSIRHISLLGSNDHMWYSSGSPRRVWETILSCRNLRTLQVQPCHIRHLAEDDAAGLEDLQISLPHLKTLYISGIRFFGMVALRVRQRVALDLDWASLLTMINEFHALETACSDAATDAGLWWSDLYKRHNAQGTRHIKLRLATPEGQPSRTYTAKMYGLPNSGKVRQALVQLDKEADRKSMADKKPIKAHEEQKKEKRERLKVARVAARQAEAEIQSQIHQARVDARQTWMKEEQREQRELERKKKAQKRAAIVQHGESKRSERKRVQKR
jgi:hypothetical protein